VGKFVDRDGKLVKEFQTTFHSTFWELYVHAVLRDFKFEIDFSVAAPDFVVTGTRAFTVEAVAAMPPGGGDLKPSSNAEMLEQIKDLNVLNEAAIIRLSNSFLYKVGRYRASYGALNYVAGRPFVLAISAFDSPAFFLLGTRPIEALLYNYYVDEQRYLEGEASILRGRVLDRVHKANGARIPLGTFSSEKYAEISAVLYNPCATWGKVRVMSDLMPGEHVSVQTLRRNVRGVEPHVLRFFKQGVDEHLLDGLCVFHNPFALHPLPPETFRHPLVQQDFWDAKQGDWVHERSEGHLLHRQLTTFKPPR
jgi:hypothetical protein